MCMYEAAFCKKYVNICLSILFSNSEIKMESEPISETKDAIADSEIKSSKMCVEDESELIQFPEDKVFENVLEQTGQNITDEIETKSNNNDASNNIKILDIYIDDLKGYNLRQIKRTITLEDDMDQEQIEPKKSKQKKAESDKNDMCKVFNCNICDCTFQSESAFTYHKNSHAKDMEHTCDQCHDTFDANENLLKHKKVHDKDDNCFQCTKCKKAFSDHRAYANHKIAHLKKPPYNCFECNFQFMNKASFKAHIYIHYNIEKMCTVCKQRVPRIRMAAHMSSHNIIECVECGKSIRKSFYTYHMAIHSGVKKYQCWYCGQGFVTHSQRLVHTRIHTGARPHKCSICHKTFVQSVDLIRHKERHKQKEHYECDYCAKKYTMKQSLVTHLRLHNNYKPYKCPFCPERFHQSLYLTMHTYKKHIKENRFKCEMCDKTFKLKNGYRKHLVTKEHHKNAYKHIVKG